MMKQFLDFITESLDNYYPIEKTPDKDTPAYVLAEYTFTHMNKLYAVRFGKAKEIASKNRALELYMGEKRSKTSVKKKMTSTSKPRMLLATLLEVLNRELTEPGQKSGSVYGYMISMQLEDFDVFAPFITRFMKKKFQNRLVVSDITYNPINPEKMRGIYITRKEFSFDFVFNKLELPAELSDTSDEDTAPVVPKEKEKSPRKPPEPPKKNSVAPPSPIEQQQKNIFNSLAKPPTEQEKNKVQSKFKDVYVSLLKQTNQFFTVHIDDKLIDSITEDELTTIIHMGLDSAYSDETTFAEYRLALKLSGISSSGFEFRTIERYRNLMANHPGVDPNSFRTVKTKYGDKRILNPLGMSKHEMNDVNKYIENGVDVNSVVYIDEVSDERLKEIHNNAQSIIKSAGKSVESVASKQTLLEKMMSEIVDSLVMSKISIETTKKMFLTVFEDASKRNIDFDDIKHGNLHRNMLRKFGEVLFVKSESSSELDEFSELLPDSVARYIDTGMFIKDTTVFTENFVSHWTATGGTAVHKAALAWLNGELQNKDSPVLWNGEIPVPELDREINPLIGRNLFDMKGKSTKGIDKFNSIYQETQEFFKEKLGKKYETKYIKLYRGVGERNATKYVPGAIESWTTMVSTAKAFAKMMDRAPGKPEGTVFQIEVPAKEIWATFETLKKYGFPPEEYLKGKKEHILFGGALSKYPCIIYGSDERVISFREFMEMNEREDDEENNKRRPGQVEILYPNDPDFVRKTRNDTGWALEPNEDLTKGSPSSDD